MSKTAEKELKTKFKIVFGTDEGKKVLSHICRECGVLQPSYVMGMRPEDAIYRDGMRNAALMILTLLDETPERFLELAQEIQTNAE